MPGDLFLFDVVKGPAACRLEASSGGGGMPETSLFEDLTIALAAALIGGVVATRLRLPVILGYLLSGVLIGPHGWQWIRDPAQIDRLALVGVVLLMFALGAEFSLADLRPVWRVSLLGGTFQILATVAVVTLGVRGFGLSIASGVAIGCVLALSSTALVLRLLTDRGELDAAYGRVLMGILIVQDLAMLPMVLLLPGLAGGGMLSAGFGRELTLGLLFIVLAVGFGMRIVPRLMAFVAALGNKEVFFLTVLVLGLGLALVAQAFGISTAIGAFLAGLVISESRHSKQALAEIVPLRGLFATIFFVSLGMLFDSPLALQNAPAILWLIGSIVLGKTLLGAATAYAFGYSGRTALGVGLGLAQIGEFSFVLAGLASQEGLIPPAWFASILGASILSLMLAPFLVAAAPPLATALEGTRLARGLMRERAYRLERLRPSRLRDHVVIAGYGRMGRQIGDELRRWKVPFLVVDLSHHTTERLRTSGEEAVFGDASRPEILRYCNLPRARMLIVALPDSMSAELCLVEARRQAPDLAVVVRAHRSDDTDRFYALGAKEVIQPEFEASLEAVRRALVAFGYSSNAVGRYLHQIRARRYAAFRTDSELDLGALPPLSAEGLDLHWYEIAPHGAAAKLRVHELEHPPEQGVVLLAVRRDGTNIPVPGALEHLRPRDHVLVLGAPEALARFEQWAGTGADRLAGGNETG